MDTKDIFNSLKQSKGLIKILKEKNELSDSDINSLEFYEKTNIKIINILRTIVDQNENDTPKTSVYNLVKKYFNIS